MCLCESEGDGVQVFVCVCVGVGERVCAVYVCVYAREGGGCVRCMCLCMREWRVCAVYVFVCEGLEGVCGVYACVCVGVKGSVCLCGSGGGVYLCESEVEWRVCMCLCARCMTFYVFVCELRGICGVCVYVCEREECVRCMCVFMWEWKGWEVYICSVCFHVCMRECRVCVVYVYVYVGVGGTGLQCHYYILVAF